jgi:hypothetical protein
MCHVQLIHLYKTTTILALVLAPTNVSKRLYATVTAEHLVTLVVARVVSAAPAIELLEHTVLAALQEAVSQMAPQGAHRI